MEQSPVRELQITNTGHEPVRAFVPKPPVAQSTPPDGRRANQALAKAMLFPEAPDGISVLLLDLNRFLSACPTLANLLIPFLIDIRKSTSFPFYIAPESIEILVECDRTREFASESRIRLFDKYRKIPNGKAEFTQ